MKKGNIFRVGNAEKIVERGEERESIGFDLPFAISVSELKRSNGMELKEQHMTVEELVNEL